MTDKCIKRQLFASIAVKMLHITVILLGIASFNLPASHAYDREGRPNYQQNQFHSSSSSFGTGNGFADESSIVQNNGNNRVIINSRIGPNGEKEKFISMSNPRIIIDGDYCEAFNNF
jgi:hypothetical protein